MYYIYDKIEPKLTANDLEAEVLSGVTKSASGHQTPLGTLLRQRPTQVAQDHPGKSYSMGKSPHSNE